MPQPDQTDDRQVKAADDYDIGEASAAQAAADEAVVDVAETRELERRAEYLAGLRMLADVLEQNPELELPVAGRGTGLNVFVTSAPDQKERMAAWARVLPGKKTKGQAGTDGDLFKISVHLRGLQLAVIADRDEVCERVVVATRQVTETVPDPEALAAVPTVEVTKTVEDVKWVCRPLLAEAADGAR